MKITIVGTGLMGTSLGLALKKLGHKVCGVDKDRENLKDAMVMGGIDCHYDMKTALSESDLVVLSVPVNTISDLLPEVLDNLADGATVMDMGSTKLDICTRADEHPNREAFVAVHPMAGVEHSGPKAAHIDLYLNARVIVCDAQRSSSKSLNKVLGLLQELKMKVIFMDSDEHDRQLALVSHLPQYIAYALASMDDFHKETNKNWVELGGGGLQSSIRLGKSDATMWIPIFMQNKDYLLQYVENYMDQLIRFKKMLLDDDMETMNKTIRDANANYEKLNYGNNKPDTKVIGQGSPKVFYS